MPLTAVQVKNAKAEDKDLWLSDQKGLRLLVKTSGAKYWRLKYRFHGKQKTLALGIYPEVSLKGARLAVDEAKLLVANGVDPSDNKRQEKYREYGSDFESFESVAHDWWSNQSGTWTDDHKKRVWKRLSDNAFPQLGERPIQDIKPKDIIAVVRKIESRDALDVAGRVLQDIRRVCRYAVQLGKLDYNPATDLTDILRTRKRNHQPSLPRHELPGFISALDTYDGIGRLITKYAIQLLVLTFVRPGELRGARWEEFNFEEKLWRIPGHRMKMGTDHLVPLSTQVIELLKLIGPITGQYELLFPSEKRREESMSDNTMRRAIFKLGYDGTKRGKSKATPHGFRATASSILNEEGFNPDAIERQLSHQERNGVRAAYIHHAQYLDDRKKMMQWWADYLYARDGG